MLGFTAHLQDGTDTLRHVAHTTGAQVGSKHMNSRLWAQLEYSYETRVRLFAARLRVRCKLGVQKKRVSPACQPQCQGTALRLVSGTCGCDPVPQIAALVFASLEIESVSIVRFLL